MVLTGARYVYGGLLLALAFALRGGGLPPAAELAALLPVLALQGVVLSMVGTLLWYQTISRLDLGRATAIVVPSIPVLSLGASFLVVGEVATPRQWLGLLLTAAGVLAMVTGPAARAEAGRGGSGITCASGSALTRFTGRSARSAACALLRLRDPHPPRRTAAGGSGGLNPFQRGASRFMLPSSGSRRILPPSGPTDIFDLTGRSRWSRARRVASGAPWPRASRRRALRSR